jgi:enterochelin esterase-like enzyme
LVPGLHSKSAEYNNLLDVYFMTCGEQDPRIEYTKAVVKKMHAAGLEVDEAYYPGDHEWQVWRKSFHDFAKKLFK